jgi:hypothetical protein
MEGIHKTRITENMKKIFLVILLLSIVVNIGFVYGQSHRIYDSYKGLVMAGYQGWFNTPDDGSNRNWKHYGGKQGFKPGSCNIDLWPDVSEYSNTYKTEFSFAEGSPAKVFSSADESTVYTHFRWMKEYGIDGVFMQRFVSEIKDSQGLSHFNKVFNSAMSAAQKYDRAICVMYDLSGMKPGDANFVLSDMDNLVTKYNISSRKKCPSYLYHNRKPLVCIWGVGFNDKRAYSLEDANQLIDGLRKRGFSIMIGVPTRWRELTNDAVRDSALHTTIKKCDIVMPWFVGRYDEKSFPAFSSLIPKDLQWCKANKIDYAPLVFPGFSWKNMKGEQTKQIQRNGGNFFWSQISGAIQANCEMLYVAMFDEMDEGTAIFKCATEVPVGASKFVSLEKNLGNDHYLWLTGQAAKMLRKEIPLSIELPIRKK